jgi:hypothetical protein
VLPALSYTIVMRSTTPLLALIAAAGIAACGSSSTATNPAAKTDQMVAFAKCMRSHGVPNFPDPGSNGNGGIQIQASRRAGAGASMSVNGVSVSAPAFQSAMRTCRPELPNRGHPPPLSAARKQAMLKYSQCMREHGLTNFPDPTFGSGGTIRLQVGGQGGIDPNSPTFQQAQAACAKDRGAGAEFKAPG